MLPSALRTINCGGGSLLRMQASGRCFNSDELQGRLHVDSAISPETAASLVSISTTPWTSTCRFFC